MNRYIDSDKLIEHMRERYDALYKENGRYDHYTNGYGEATELVEEFPTADVVEVVRCKDCKHWNNEGYDPILESAWGECQKSFDDYHCCETTEDDYCSYGEKERKEI